MLGLVVAAILAFVGYQVLEGLHRLEYVHADECRVTDQGLLMLRNLKYLHRIYIGVTKAAPGGVAELERQLPDCSVVYVPDG